MDAAALTTTDPSSVSGHLNAAATPTGSGSRRGHDEYPLSCHSPRPPVHGPQHRPCAIRRQVGGRRQHGNEGGGCGSPFVVGDMDSHHPSRPAKAYDSSGSEISKPERRVVVLSPRHIGDLQIGSWPTTCHPPEMSCDLVSSLPLQAAAALVVNGNVPVKQFHRRTVHFTAARTRRLRVHERTG
jgi:hypothetical protein